MSEPHLYGAEGDEHSGESADWTMATR